MVAAKRPPLERARPVLDTYAERVFHPLAGRHRPEHELVNNVMLHLHLVTRRCGRRAATIATAEPSGDHPSSRRRLGSPAW